MVEFAGENLRLPQNAEALKPNLNSSPGSITALRTFTSADKKSCRIWFELDFGKEVFSELRLVMEAAGHPISETWLYRWTL
jgi:glucans biosynthesis protein